MYSLHIWLDDDWPFKDETYLCYTGCPRRKGPNFGRVFLRSNYTDITQNTYIQSSMVTEILAREKCGRLWCLRTLVSPWRDQSYAPDIVQTVYELPLLPNNNNNTVKHFYTNRSGAKCWLDIYRWGADLAVTGRIRDIRQKVLQSSFETGSCNSPPFCSLSHSPKRPLLEI